MIYAILNSEGKCINRTVWDGESNWQPPEGCTVIEDPDNLYPIYQEPLPETEAEQTIEQKLESAGLSLDDLKEALGLP